MQTVHIQHKNKEADGTHSRHRDQYTYEGFIHIRLRLIARIIFVDACGGFSVTPGTCPIAVIGLPCCFCAITEQYGGLHITFRIVATSIDVAVTAM